MRRKPIEKKFDVGIRAINSLLTLGCGQRIGLIAGSGVGKSVLLGMMTKFSIADVIVIGLIGERGREVKEFIEMTLGPEGQKAVVVAAPSDNSPLLRLRATNLAHSTLSSSDGKEKMCTSCRQPVARRPRSERNRISCWRSPHLKRLSIVCI